MTDNPLPPEKLPVVLTRIAAWRLAPEAPVACPVCESARPYAEWYALSCTACGLKATINVPLGPQVPGSDA